MARPARQALAADARRRSVKRWLQVASVAWAGGSHAHTAENEAREALPLRVEHSKDLCQHSPFTREALRYEGMTMSLEGRPLGTLGVEVVGLDLREPIPESQWRALRELVVNEGLVVFRDQPMSPEHQIELGRRFGPLENTSLEDGPMDVSKIELSNVDESGQVLSDDDVRMQLVAVNEGWHTDGSFSQIPASFSLFAAVEVPDEGGDTFYASQQRAWDALPEAERAALFGLHGRHDYDRAYAARNLDMQQVFDGPAPSSVHPIVRRHPETGRTGLFVSEHVFEIEGMPAAEARALVRRLLDVCTDPARVYRHRWSPGDLLIWDNRSMLHRAEGFDPRHARVMRHVRVAGTEPTLAAGA
jgi:taurine dioxygenase